MTGINPIGPGGGGGFDPNHRKSPEERRAEAERLKQERKMKREQIAKENVEKTTEQTREKVAEYWTDDDGQDHVNAVR